MRTKKISAPLYKQDSEFSVRESGAKEFVNRYGKENSYEQSRDFMFSLYFSL